MIVMSSSEQHQISFESFWHNFGQYSYFVRDCELNEKSVDGSRFLRFSKDGKTFKVSIFGEAENLIKEQEFDIEKVEIEVAGEGVNSEVFVFEQDEILMIINCSGEFDE